jgi:hypothetical protein
MALATGSMGPKAEVAARFVTATGGMATIGRLEDAAQLLAGSAGTTVRRPVTDRVHPRGGGETMVGLGATTRGDR